jgi:PAS domain S-box-containing protein
MGKGITGFRSTGDLSGLRQIIAGLTEGVILIDPDQTILWANDTALKMHGGASLGDLGRTVTEYRERFQLRYRNNHPLEANDYPIERVMDGEAFSEVVVEVARAGAEEPEWVHQVRSLIVTGEHGDPEYLVLILQDVSLRFEAEERFEQAFNANPAPALICRLSDLRFIKANRGFLEMTGFGRDIILGHTVFEFDIFNRATERDLAKERLSERRTIPQMEAELTLPDGETRLVIVAGQPIDIREEPCMLFTFADLEPRRKAEKALVQSEDRFAQAFRMAPVAMLVASLRSHRVLDANQAFQTMTGHGEECFVGRSPSELPLWDTADTRRRLEQELEAEGGLKNIDAKVRTKGGELLDALVSAATISIERRSVRPLGHPGHHRTPAFRAGAHHGDRGGDEGRQLVQPRHRREAGEPEGRAGPGAGQGSRRPDQAGEGGPRPSLPGIGRSGDRRGVVDVAHDGAKPVARIYAKIGVNRRGAAIVWGRERGLAQGKLRDPKERIR